jgi:YHS domain-containing protein
MSAARCVVCGAPLGADALRVRYENRVYVFDAIRCKRIFQENPDRYLDAEGHVLPEPR